MVIVAISVNELLKVVEDLELAKQEGDALITGGQDSQPGQKLAHHRLIDPLLSKESLSGCCSDSVDLDLLSSGWVLHLPIIDRRPTSASH